MEQLLYVFGVYCICVMDGKCCCYIRNRRRRLWNIRKVLNGTMFACFYRNPIPVSHIHQYSSAIHTDYDIIHILCRKKKELEFLHQCLM